MCAWCHDNHKCIMCDWSHDNHKCIMCQITLYQRVQKEMDVDKHKRLSNITLRHNSTCIAVLHFTRVIGSSTMSITHMQKHVKRHQACS
jgi:hypothetical protein